MPKKAPKNAYFFYMLEYRDKEARKGHTLTIAECSTNASPSWQRLTKEQKAKYEEMAKREKSTMKQESEIRSSLGIPISRIESEHKLRLNQMDKMKRTIEKVITDSYIKNCLDTEEYCFIMANYLVKTNDGVYIPCEIALVKYSLRNGVTKRYHSYLKSDFLPMGYAYEAQEHTNKTHRLPLPPRSIGESKWADVLCDIADFLGATALDELPAVYTLPDNIPIVQSVLTQLCASANEDKSIFTIYSLTELFFLLKKQAVKSSINLDACEFKSIHIAQALIERDTYDYEANIACQYHDQIDASKFCALSWCMRWAYLFSDHICLDINIDLVCGKHVPINADVSVVNELKSEYDDSKSMISETTMKSEDTASYMLPPMENKRLMSDVASTSGRTIKSEDFPELSVRSSKSINNNPSTSKKQKTKDNPTNHFERSHSVNEPDDEAFSFASVSAGRGILRDRDTASVRSLGRGRFI